MKPASLIAAIVAGALGAAAWAAIAHYMNYELGFMAWLVGGAVGFAAATAARGEATQLTGLMAAGVAVLAVVGGKYAAVHAGVAHALGSSAGELTMTDEDMKVRLADDVVREFEAANRPVVWPQGKDIDSAESQADYPADVWAEATKRWDALEPSEQADRKAAAEAQAKVVLSVLSGTIEKKAFLSSFRMIDILFFLLAIVTAFKVGSGGLDS